MPPYPVLEANYAEWRFVHSRCASSNLLRNVRIWTWTLLQRSLFYLAATCPLYAFKFSRTQEEGWCVTEYLALWRGVRSFSFSC